MGYSPSSLGSSNINTYTNANSSGGSDDVFNNNNNNMMTMMNLSINIEGRRTASLPSMLIFNAADGSTFNEGIHDDDGTKEMDLKFLL